jgi:hypothetical protein
LPVLAPIAMGWPTQTGNENKKWFKNPYVYGLLIAGATVHSRQAKKYSLAISITSLSIRQAIELSPLPGFIVIPERWLC